MSQSLIVENDHLRLEIGPDGCLHQFSDRSSAVNHLNQNAANAFCRAFRAGRECVRSGVRLDAAGCGLEVSFDQGSIRVRLALEAKPQWIEVSIVGVEGSDLDRVVFADTTLTLRGQPDEPFSASVLALNLQTNVREWPGQTDRFQAICYPRFGFAGAALAIIGCPTAGLRSILQDVVRSAPALPRNLYGGPWAMDAAANRGSYLFNFGAISTDTVDAWIEVANSFGFSQIDFHGGPRHFCWGDLIPFPGLFPQGRTSLKAVIDKLHAAGISAGLHTYSCFVDRTAPTVSPLPHPDLDEDAVFTLSSPIEAHSTEIPVLEPLDPVADTLRPSLRGDRGVTIRIDDELITYTALRSGPMWAFTDCQRGACGTVAAAHTASSRVRHLKQCWWGLLMPQGDSPLFDKLARRHADVFNECGFDMIYFDALDGEDLFAGPEHGWHYGSKFVFEVCRHLNKPAVIEMAAFHHHLWCVRSRMEAWDHPTRAYKLFVDRHVASLERNRPALMPAMLGWWAAKFWEGPNTEPTYADDIEYLCCKALAIDSGHGLMNIEPERIKNEPGLQRLAAIFKKYETLRLGNQVPPAIRRELKAPGHEFRLITAAGGRSAFVPVQCHKHKIEGRDAGTHGWHVNNVHGPQPLRFRLEALLSATPYDAPGNLTLTDLGQQGGAGRTHVADGVVTRPLSAAERAPDGSPSVSLRAVNQGCPVSRAWSVMRRTFDSPLNLLSASEPQSPYRAAGLGFWVRGDGRGETLNVRLYNAAGVTRAISDRYVVIDFTGWRYCELVEQEAEHYFDYEWPVESTPQHCAEHERKAFYELYRESLDFTCVASLGIWYQHLPAGKEVECCISPLKALGLINGVLRSPTISLGGQTVTFPVVLQSGEYLEYDGGESAVHYGRNGGIIATVQPAGGIPLLTAGRNQLSLAPESIVEAPARARISVVTQNPKRLEW